MKNKNNRQLVSGLMAAALMGLLSSGVQAQNLNSFLNSLKNLKVPSQGSQNLAPADSSALNGLPGGNAAPAQGPTGRKGLGAKLTENYCKNLYSVASLESRGPVNEALISEEFNIDPKDFYDEMVKGLDAKPGYTGYAFPGVNFYQHEFETDKIGVIFDLLLSYPSPKYMAALIAEARTTGASPRYDNQIKVDAVAALAILHYRLQDKSKRPGRWQELAASLQNEDHYLAKVITARLLKSGELGRVNPDKAISLLSEANNARNRYQQEQQGRKVSSKNYAITSNQTLFDVVLANPGNSQARNYSQFVQSYKAGLASPEPVPAIKNQLESGLAEVQKSSDAATEKARQLLSGTTEVVNIQAQKSSLDSAMRNRVSDVSEVNADQRTLAALARQMEKVEKLDESQKVLLNDAIAHSHDSGDKAIAMMPTMMNAMFTTLSQRGMEHLPSLIPYAKRLQAYSDGACSVVTRLDHVAMTKKLAAVDPERSALASLVDQK